jgi:hypothetical protein
MNRLEDALREALRREPAPDGFAERVLRAAESRSEARVNSGGLWARLGAAFRGPRVRWAAGFAAAAMVFSAVEVRNQRERVEGEKAKQQLMLALRITGGKLRLAKAGVYRMSHISVEQ